MTVTPDIARLEHLLAWATEEEAKRQRGEPSEWGQDYFIVNRASCDTACCIAGKVALEDGVEILWTDYGYGSHVQLLGSRVGIDEYARFMLGLTVKQADVLFSSENDLEALRQIIDAIKQGASAWQLSRLHQDLLEDVRGYL